MLSQRIPLNALRTRRTLGRGGPEAVNLQPTTEAVEPQPTVLSTGGFSDVGLDALTPEEIQVAIESDRLTDRQLTRAVMALGAETTVNAKQVHRKRLLAARRTQDKWARGLGDLIRTYSQSAEDPDQTRDQQRVHKLHNRPKPGRL